MAKNKNKTDFWRTIYIYLCTLLCSKCPECIGTSTGTVQYWYWYWYWYCTVLVLVLVLVLYSILCFQVFIFSKHKCIIYSINCIIIGASFVRFFKVGSGIKPKYFWQRIYELLSFYICCLILISLYCTVHQLIPRSLSPYTHTMNRPKYPK